MAGKHNDALLANEEADDLEDDGDDDDEEYYLHEDDDGSSDDDDSMDDHSSTVQRRAGTYLKDRETKVVQTRINNKSTAAKEAARTANCTGYIVLASLLIGGITLSVITYFYVFAAEENDSQAAFMMSAQEVVTHSNENAQNLYEALQMISKLFSASVDDSTAAMSNLETMPTPLLPNVTLPDFEAFAMSARNSTGALVIAYAPLIAHLRHHDKVNDTTTTASSSSSSNLFRTLAKTGEAAAVSSAEAEAQRLAWEQYALAHADWILRGHLFHPETSALFASTTTTDAAGADSSSNLTAAQQLQQQHQAQDVVLQSIMAPIPAKIWCYNPDTSIDQVETGPPPYSPAWQLSPPPYDNSIVNFNYASRLVYAKLVAATLGETTMSTSNNTNKEDESKTHVEQQQEQPLWQQEQWLLSEPFDTRLLYGNALPKNPSDQNYKNVYDLTADDETTNGNRDTTTSTSFDWDGQEQLASPQSILVVPVVASLIGSTSLGSVGSKDHSQNPYNVVAGHISAAIPWTTVLLTNLLPREKNKGPLHVVVDSCNGMHVHTYEIQGINARYVGPGDLHEPEQTKMVYTATLNPYMPPPPPQFNITDLQLRLEQLRNQTMNTRSNNTNSNSTNATNDAVADLQAILLAEEQKRNDKNKNSNQTAGAAALIQNATMQNETLNNGLICQHVLYIYPTAAYAESHTSNDPIVYTVALVCVVAVVIFLFLVYDYVVRRQQNKVLGEAERSNAIIASLFPTQVARKLFDSAGGHAVPVGGAQGGGRGTDAAMRNSDHGGGQRRNRGSGGSAGGGGAGGSGDLDASAMMSKGVVGGRPIAELFPEATVMFADIAGFTAWSSIREPTQVFELLEAIFQSFDTIANRRGVFKVETVGDCYVAVCGVPEPCADHAVVMARFARECLSRCEKVLQSLELKLGPDTGDLAMRFGLNSGPVTAGVLRGDRARFQLFGDTVNTAARIESTGKRDRIHLSESTANIIIAAGKADWVKPRDEPVEAKGKGLMNTFWLEVRGQNMTDDGEVIKSEAVVPTKKKNRKSPPKRRLSGSNKSSSADNLHVNEIPTAIGQRGTSRKVQRLIDWNSELLLQLLKHVIARRNALAGRRTTQAALTAMASNIGEGATVVEEVTEVIMLPDFDHVKVDPESVELTPEVVEQCRSYVALIASMYRDNPFHNFEHASHVTMSVSKLLSRIVAPQIDRESLSDDKHEELLLHDHTYGITSDPLTQFSVVLSALIHDVDHRGVPNFLLCKESPDLAALYKDKSVAEQNSVDLAWHCLMSEGFEALRCCIFADIAELRRFRQLLVNSVIATDIFDKDQSTLRKNRWDKAFAHKTVAETKTDINRKATIVIEHLIQASDVAHTMQHWHVYQKWNERLFEEMYISFLSGRSEKDPSEGWFNGEIWFFDNYVIPLAKKLKECGVFGVSSDEYLNYALDNRREWADKGGDIVSRLVEKFNGEGNKNEEKLKKEAKAKEDLVKTLALGRAGPAVKPKEEGKKVQDLATTLAMGRQIK